LKPSFFTDAELADCNAYGMLAFAGLWCHADREGRLRDQPRELKVKILPYFEVDFDAVLTDLANGGFITRYEVEDKAYVQVENFTEHQNPHPKEPSMGYPANPHGCAEPLKEIANNVLQPSRAGAPAKGVRGKGLDLVLNSLEKLWPSTRCRGSHSELREKALWKVRDELPDDIPGAAELYLAAHAFTDQSIEGCPNLHKWIEERRWRDPLPGRSAPSSTQTDSAKYDAGIEVA
jgi:hypothetical protein